MLSGKDIRAIDFAALILSPDIVAKLPRHSNNFGKDVCGSTILKKMSFAKSDILSTMSPLAIPQIALFLKKIAKVSKAKIKKIGDKGHPCLTPTGNFESG